MSLRRIIPEMQQMFRLLEEPLLKADWPVRSMMKTRPAVNLFETDKAYEIEADLPGVKKDDLNVEVTEDGGLILTGKSEAHKERKHGSTWYVERSQGEFERHFNFPSKIDVDKINAKFDNGVLKLEIPKSENQASKKKISIGE